MFYWAALKEWLKELRLFNVEQRKDLVDNKDCKLGLS